MANTRLEYNCASVVTNSLQGHATKLALSCEGDSFTRKEFLREIAARRARFCDHDVKAGTRVIIVSGRGSRFWADFVALWSLGAIAIPLDPTIEDTHALEIARAAKPTHISGEFKTPPQALDGLTHISEDVISARDEGDAVGELEIEPVQPDTLAGLFFTSGSTGLPKGVMIRHEMLIANMYASQARVNLLPSDTLFIAIPFRFISSISHFLVTVLAGAIFVGSERNFMPKALIESMHAADITAFGGSPLQVRLISNAPRSKFPRLRWIMSSGDHLSEEIIKVMREARPEVSLNAVYGLTELAGRFCTLSPEQIDAKPGSVGRPIPGLGLAVLDDDGRNCKPHEIGHVYARGICCLDGYVGNEAATRKAVTGHGFRTGDMGALDEDGDLFLAGRSDSVFKRSGLKVSCIPIVEVLMKLGVFKDVAVMPRDDELEGAVPVAYVVLQDSVEFQRAEVLGEIRSVLSPKHLPADFIVVEEIPRTRSGKVKSHELVNSQKSN